MIKKLLALALLVCIPAASFGQICTPCSLQTVTGSPFEIPGEPLAIAFSPSCRVLAAAFVEPTASRVVVYPINADCSLDLAGAITIATLPNTSGNGAYQTVAFSPSGQCLAVGDSLGNVTMFTVSTDCSIFTQVPLTPIASGGDNITKVAFSPDGGCLATSNFSSNSVSLFRVEANCSLTSIGASPFLTGSIQPTSVAFSPDGSYVIATNDQIIAPPNQLGAISLFCVLRDEAGNCTGLSTPSVINTELNIQTPELAVFSPEGNCLAIANGIGNGARRGVALYSFSALPCTPDSIAAPVHNQQVFDGRYTPAAAFSPFGGCLAAVDNFSNTVLVATLNPDDCTSITSQEIPIGAGELSPSDIVFSPNAQCLAVANRTNSISIFRTNILIAPVISVQTSCDGVTITGTTTPDVIVTAFANGNAIGSDTSDEAGNFSITAPLVPGMYTINVQASNGTCTAVSENVTVTIVNLSGLTFGINTTCLLTARITGSVTVNPAGTPVTISIFVDGSATPIASNTFNSNGNGLVTFVFPAVSLPQGEHAITVQAQASGCIISLTNTVNVVYPPCNFGAAPNLALCANPCPPKPCK